MYAAMLTLDSSGSRSMSQLAAPCGWGRCGGAASVVPPSGAGGGVIRTGRWKGIRLTVAA